MGGHARMVSSECVLDASLPHHRGHLAQRMSPARNGAHIFDHQTAAGPKESRGWWLNQGGPQKIESVGGQREGLAVG